MLLDVANAVNSACLSGLAEELGLSIDLAHPSIAALSKESAELGDVIIKTKELDKIRLK